MFLFFSSITFAKDRAFVGQIYKQRIPLDVPNADIKFYRFVSASGHPNHGEPLVFPHGLLSNIHEFEPWVEEAMKQGFDVYAGNDRGHGDGDEKSVVLDYHDGDYGFFKMARDDFPAMLKKAREISGKKVTVIGHSMGGMIPRASIAMGAVDQADIKSLVLIGSPPHFKSKNSFLPSMIEEPLLNFILAGRGDESFSLTDVFAIERRLDQVNSHNPVYWIAKFGLNMSAEIMSEAVTFLGIHDTNWANRARTKSVPKDIIRSFVEFQKEYPYEDVRLNVPALYIMGQSDALVRANDIRDHATVQSQEAGYWLITLKGVGHISLVGSDALALYKESVQKFLRDPYSIGPPNETHLTYTCGKLLTAI